MLTDITEIINAYRDILKIILTESRAYHKMHPLSNSLIYYFCITDNKHLVITSKELLSEDVIPTFVIGYSFNNKWHLYLNKDCEWNIEYYNNDTINEFWKF